MEVGAVAGMILAELLARPQRKIDSPAGILTFSSHSLTRRFPWIQTLSVILVYPDRFAQNQPRRETHDYALPGDCIIAAHGNPFEALELAEGLFDTGAEFVELLRREPASVLRVLSPGDSRGDAARGRRPHSCGDGPPDTRSTYTEAPGTPRRQRVVPRCTACRRRLGAFILRNRSDRLTRPWVEINARKRYTRLRRRMTDNSPSPAQKSPIEAGSGAEVTLLERSASWKPAQSPSLPTGPMPANTPPIVPVELATTEG